MSYIIIFILFMVLCYIGYKHNAEEKKNKQKKKKEKHVEKYDKDGHYIPDYYLSPLVKGFLTFTVIVLIILLFITYYIAFYLIQVS